MNEASIAVKDSRTNPERDMLRDSVDRALRDAVTPRRTLACEADAIDRDATAQLAALGLTGIDAASLGVAEQATVIQGIGYAAALVSYPDTEALGRWVALEAGLEPDDGTVFALACVDDARLDGKSLRVKNLVVPAGRFATRVVLVGADGEGAFVGSAPADALKLVAAHNLAGEARDRCGVDTVELVDLRRPDAISLRAVRRRGALYRTAAMIGAATRANELALQYALDRRQFGKAIASFQVIQSYLAQMAGELVAASAMFAVAVDAEVRAEGGDAEIAAARVRACQAARTIATLAHQVHGAMGFTQEYPLHLSTRRLWSWREEYGNETHWARELGSMMVALGGDGYWERITA